jgi:hypothetical protein
LGWNIWHAWQNRAKKLKMDWAIAGWMLCPIPEIMEHCRKNKVGTHHDAVDRVINKLYAHLGTAQCDIKKDIFWGEWADFHNMCGPVYSKPYIKNSQHLRNGDSHYWHAQFTEPFTEVLGWVACRVTSKLLGIGSCERAWSAVKFLKDKQRSHLSAEKIARQATIFSSTSIEKARARRAAGGTLDSAFTWTDSDLQFESTISEWGGNFMLPPTRTLAGPKRYFKTWFEDWEESFVKKRDPVIEAKFLRKYGGLSWLDPDNGNALVSARTDKMEYHGGRKGTGWNLIAVSEDGDEEPWSIELALDQIKEHTQPFELNVELINLPEQEA